MGERALTKIASAGNSDTAAYAVLWQQGCELEIVSIAGRSNLVAKIDGNEFWGESALEVLGLVTIFKERGPSWRPTDQEVVRVTKFEEQGAIKGRE